MTILAFDCCLNTLSVALFDKNRQLIGSLSHHHQLDAPALLTPMIKRLLSDASLKMYDINQCIFTVGPGSFTGVRVAVSTVYGIKVAIPDMIFLPINTLQAMRLSYEQSSSLGLTLMAADTKTNECYTQVIDKNLNEKSEIKIYPPDETLELTEENNIILTNNKSLFSGYTPNNIEIIEQNILSTSLINALDFLKPNNGEICPIYGRNAAVTIKK